MRTSDSLSVYTHTIKLHYSHYIISLQGGNKWENCPHLVWMYISPEICSVAQVSKLQYYCLSTQTSVLCAHTQKQFRLYQVYIILWTSPVWLLRSPPVLLYSHLVDLFLPHASSDFHTRLSNTIKIKLTLSKTQIQYLSLPAFRFQQKSGQLWIFVHLNLLFTKYCLKSSYWKPTFSSIY